MTVSFGLSFLKGLFVWLVDIKIRVKIYQPTCDSVCEDNSWIYGKCRQRFYARQQELL